MYLKSGKPGHHLEFNECLSVPKVCESSVRDGDKLLFEISPEFPLLLCPVSEHPVMYASRDTGIGLSEDVSCFIPPVLLSFFSANSRESCHYKAPMIIVTF